MQGIDILHRVRQLTGNSSYSGYEGINSAYRDLAQLGNHKSLRRESEAVAFFNSSTNTYSFNVQQITTLTGLFIRGGVGGKKWVPITELSPTDFTKEESTNTNVDGTTNKRTPVFFTLKGQEDTLGNSMVLKVTPDPSQDFDILAHYITDVTDLTDNTAPFFNNMYHEIVAYQAAFEHLMLSKDPAEVEAGFRLENKFLKPKKNNMISSSMGMAQQDIDTKPKRWLK